MTIEDARSIGKVLKLRLAFAAMLVVAAAFAVVLLLDQDQASDGLSQDSSASSTGWVGTQAPDFKLSSMDGSLVSLKDLKGKAVVLNFWATWCIPCRTEMPELQHVYSERGNEGLVILAVNVEESQGQVKEYLDEMQLTLPVILDRDGKVRESYRVLGLPSSFFIGKDGVIKAVGFGALNRSALDRRINSALLTD